MVYKLYLFFIANFDNILLNISIFKKHFNVS